MNANIPSLARRVSAAVSSAPSLARRVRAAVSSAPSLARRVRAAVSNAPSLARRVSALLLLVTLPVRAADVPAPGTPVLHLASGDFLEGKLLAADQPSHLRWQSPSFTRPFDFPLASVNSMRNPASTSPAHPEGELCFELGLGDLLYGSLVGITPDSFEIDSPHFGRLTVARAHVRRFFRNRDAEVIFTGPQGLVGWREDEKASLIKTAWREVVGQPTTDVPGATLRSTFDLPSKSLIEVEVAWDKQSDFALIVGTSEKPDADQQAYRFENWGSTLVVSRETESKADLQAIQAIEPGSGRTRLQIYLDQESNRLLVYSASGSRLADLHVVPDKQIVLPKIALTNVRGDVRLERLRVSRWSGAEPQPVDAAKTRLHRRDGSITYADLVAYDPATKKITIREGDEEKIVALDDFSNVFVSAATQTGAPPVRVVLLDGSQIGGEPIEWVGDRLQLKSSGVTQPLAIALANLRSLIVTGAANPSHAPPAAAKSTEGPASVRGVLLLEGSRSRGHLIDGRELGDSSCLVWKPNDAVNGSPLRRDVAGRIVYREAPRSQDSNAALTPTPLQAAGRGDVLAEPPIGQMVTALSRLFSGGAPPATSSAPRSIFLRGGDAFPYTSLSIDEKGVTFRTPVSDVSFLPHDQIKAIEMIPSSQPLKLGKTKRARLMTLPRLQRDSPPTQLVRSTGGDYLRGRLLSLDERQLTMEVRLETKRVERRLVSHIIWLHPDELDQTSPVITPTPSADGLRVQAVRGDGIRLTFRPSVMEEGKLSGPSPWLGACHVDLKIVDQLLINQQIDVAAADLPYHSWRLSRATEPKVAQNESDDSPGAGRAGTDSPLVGQPAPDFQLPLLDGQKFHLASRKGKIVILDFWATWCGPCLRTMPQIESVVGDLPKDSGVELIAVNLEETPRQITPMLERHKLKLTVALDEDGAVAAKYAATAIPQTVIIDRDGKVARLFVGGGPKFGDELRAALQEILAGNSAKN